METTLSSREIALKDAWGKLKSEQPNLRIRDAAVQLAVSEAELLATQVGESVTRLKDDWTSLLVELKKLGKVMALTRNDGCVLEHKGNFQKISIEGSPAHQMATVIGPIEQRVFFSAWKFGFAVVNDTPRGVMRSIQFFDKSGTAIMKIYVQDDSKVEVFNELVEAYKSADQDANLEIEQFAKPSYAEKIDLEAFTKDWEEMKDTHDFFGMLRKYKVHRMDAVKWIDDKWAYEVDRLAARRILETASSAQLPIMIFAGNKGNIQIHQGKVRTIKQMGNWLNVLDPQFNMHLDENQIAHAFVVHKNTEDGVVSSLELFDKEGEMIAQFFGLRKPGLPQLSDWKALIDSL
ncbi:hemin-degrading factor [Belliella kenyensis]|uniref:Hemin-degrading factor n=1 Tax=Belliella kenyensis TaxID=1472724 RepID=A0ABV8EQI4_9BACT|nr:ChuX/HutX family heme-like substrate-binding protein [Belliella kenyensis]MCH7401485.1 hemin-degrading factor [Belliella kenyensis]MDN3603234.1 ChuX/HutX family heme-like substrate-binding protein [Belliella kenyensis]